MIALLGLAVPVLTFAILLSVGLELSRADFQAVARRRGVVVAGLVGPPLALPPTALALIWAFDPPAAAQSGLLLIAACPIGGISTVCSFLARESPALSVVLTGLSGLVAVASIPLLDRVFAALLGHALGLSAPVPTIVGQLLVMLALPIGLGMWVRNPTPSHARPFKTSERTRNVGDLPGTLLC